MPFSFLMMNFDDQDFFSIFQSGSQNDLVDSWRDEDEATTSGLTSEGVSAANARWNTPTSGAPSTTRHLSAEYPFHKNLCMPPQGINFDLTHKRGIILPGSLIGLTNQLLLIAAKRWR